jgi:hypothetical protein
MVEGGGEAGADAREAGWPRGRWFKIGGTGVIGARGRIREEVMGYA